MLRLHRDSTHLPASSKFHLLLTGLLCLWTITISIGFAQTPLSPSINASPKLKLVRISLWPEYDDPRLLVILRGELDDTTSLPLQIAVPIPAGAEVIATAYTSPSGDLFQTPFQQTSNGALQVVSWTVPVATFHMEYYLDIVPKVTDRTKIFNFDINLPYPAEKVELDVKQPLGATNFTMSPAPLKWEPDSNGQQTASYTFNQVPANDTQTVNIRYSRSMSIPSFTKGQPAPPTLTTNRPTWPLYLAGLLGLIGAGMLAYGLYQQRQNNSKQNNLGERRKGKGKAHAYRQTFEPNLADKKLETCQACGMSLAQGVNFCPRCGEPVSHTSIQRLNSFARLTMLLSQVLRQHPFWLAIGLLVVALIVSLGWWVGRTLPAAVSFFTGNWL